MVVFLFKITDNNIISDIAGKIEWSSTYYFTFPYFATQIWLHMRGSTYHSIKLYYLIVYK